MRRSFLVMAAATTLAAGIAQASPIRQTIDVSVTVPTATFYVKPRTGWPQAPIQLAYDPVVKKFDTYTLPLQILNASNDVVGSLAYTPALTEATSGSQLSLDVTVGGKVLTLIPQVIHAKANAEAAYWLAITSTQNTPTPGNYLGSISLVFDETPAVP